MSEVNDYTKPPRTMPTTFARQEQEIKRLRTELNAIRKAMRGYADSDLVSLAETLVASNEAIVGGCAENGERRRIVSNPIENKIELQTKRGDKWVAIIEWNLAEMVKATAKYEELKGKRRKYRLVHVLVNLLATNEETAN